MLHQKRNVLALQLGRKPAGKQADTGTSSRRRENLYTPPPTSSPSPSPGDEMLEWRQSGRKLADQQQILSARQRDLFGCEPEFDQVRASAERRRAKQADRDNDDESLTSSSVSFARSGCHSILSAWRLKAANRNSGRFNSRSSARSSRPLSVLSTTSSRKSALSSATNATATRGKSPASASRIALGPKAAQQFVTNSKRRRRANELILNTLEARRRVLEQQTPSELLGSLSYLAEPDGLDCAPASSLSPSPAAERPLASPRQALARPPLAETNARVSPQTRLSRPEPMSAGEEQRERILRRALSSSSGARAQAAPRARPDQNSSDLCSSVTSDDNQSSQESNSSGSQFTQLMSGELAPDCISRLLDKTAQAGTRRRDSELTTSSTALEPAESGRLRRGALRRDSIRRLRLNRSSSQSQCEEPDEEKPSSRASGQPIQLETLPKSRRLDIENNPFLNRHHFRTTSGRGSRLSQSLERDEPLAGGKRLQPEAADSRWNSRSSMGETAAAGRAQQAPATLQTNVDRPSPVVRHHKVSSPVDEPASGRMRQPTDRTVVREADIKSHHDLKFNSVGNSKQLQTSQFFRHEASLDGKVTSESLSRERIQVIHSTSISPPLEFADPPGKPVVGPRRSLSEERPARSRAASLAKPPLAPRPARLSPQGEILAKQPAASQPAPKLAPKPTGPTQREHKSDLPVFERTADAEFRKRVEYLRRLARANLAEKPDADVRSTSSSLGAAKTRPLSTNWSGSSAVGAEPRSLASWGRSNSSLAALGRPRTSSLNSARPASPANSLQPQPAPTPLKFVVRERSAPRLDCAAFVKEPAAKAIAEVAPQVRAHAGPSGVQPAVPERARPAPDRRAPSPRSPEFAAASSNDDSAIASSLSSPSLSQVPQASPAGRSQSQVASAQTGRLAPALRLPSATGTLQSILRRQQALQGSQQQLAASLDSSDASSSGAAGPAASPAGGQQAPESSQQPKRVHFNDRTSIRSFESVSSLAESGSTAVAADLLRRQLGSPDSMNSASSASRLSAESPDLRGRAGAAIYAVRGDPELGVAEAPPPPMPLVRPVYLGAGQPAYLAPSMPLTIRMTAPPSIGMRAPPAGYQYSPVSSLPSVQGRAKRADEEEEEDPSYVMRLRQAATRSVFNYGQAGMLSPPASQANQLMPGQRRPAPVDLRLLNFQTEV